MPDTDANGNGNGTPTPAPAMQAVRETTVHRQEHNMGLIDRLMGEMPPWQKSILTFVLIVPMVLALSGVLLQLNVGGLLNRYIDYLYESSTQQTKDLDKIIADRLAENTATLQGDMAARAAVNDKAVAEIRAALDGLVREVSQANARVATTESRVEGVEMRVGKIERYICDSDKQLGFGACALDRAPN